jgi:hypothetical protein
MKKLISFVLMMVVMATTAVAQPKDNNKDLWKTAKKEAKKLEKEGWKADGSLPLENLLYKHYQKLLDEEYQELVGNVAGNTSVTTLNQAQQWATTQALVSYAKSAGQTVRGRIAAEVGAGTANMPAADSFYEGYESKVEKEIRGELKKSFGIYKEKSNGGIDYRAYYLVNEEKAAKARLRAMELAMQESEFARANAEKISSFVQEAFKVENE